MSWNNKEQIAAYVP